MPTGGAWAAPVAAALPLTLIGPAAAGRPGDPPGASADARSASSGASGRVTTDTPAGRRHLLGGYAADTWRSFDQGMAMAAIANATHGERFRGYFTRGEIGEALRPLLEMEAFTAGPAS